MDRDRGQELQKLFVAACAAQGAAREELLQSYARSDPELVEQVRSLLTADAQPGITESLGRHLASVTRALHEPLPGRVGAYRVMGELGRGGMGVVYLAERADGEFQHRVAIKLIDTTDTEDPLHQRFLAERQILAGLVHPQITRLLDGGLTQDGRPYLVMEYVDGLPLTTYCDDHRLDVRTRLRLFVDVCAAVQHAHQNLVIHRDLKPANILVSADGQVHLLDFGIAKLINPNMTGARAPLTRMASRMMTPEYASPEQVRGESVTTASDIYSLGVLLYELLCGSPPHRLTNGSPLDIATAVCELDPDRPSVRVRKGPGVEGGLDPESVAQLRSTSVDRLARELDGDLDGIVLMALRKEPSRRYASADMLCQDVERYLTGLPVLAHRGSRRYRLGKLLRRRRVEATAAGFVLVALLGGLGFALAQSRRASRERDRAEQALAESKGVSDFLLALFEAGDGDAPPPTQLSALDLLQRGALRVTELSNQPIVHARLLDVVGQMSLHLGRLDEAQRQLEQATAIRRAALGAGSLDLASSLIHLSWVYRARNEFDVARKLVTEALEIRRGQLAAHHGDVADALYELGWLAFGPEQERIYRQALTILADAEAAAERRVTLLQALSTNLRRQGRLAEAVGADREALAVGERWFGPEHHTTGYAMIHLADHVADIERDVATAEQLCRRGLELMTRHVGENGIRLIHGLNSLAQILASQGQDEAEQLYRRALAISRSATGPEHIRVADQLQRLATELARQGRLSEAEILARDALDLSIRTVGGGHSAVTNARLPALAQILNLQKRYEEADTAYQSALQQSVGQIVGGEMRRDYGLMLLGRGDFAGAERKLLQSLTILEQAYGRPDHPNVEETKRALMALYQQLGKPEFVERYRVPPGRFTPY